MPNGLLGSAGATANEEVQVEVPSSSMFDRKSHSVSSELKSSHSSLLVDDDDDPPPVSNALKFVPNGLLGSAGTTANELVEVPSSSMLIESLIPYPTNSNTPNPLF